MSLVHYYNITKSSDLLLLFLKDYDNNTYEHSIRVGQLAKETARALNLDEAYIKRITLGALLHDIGKLKVPKAILNKEGSLTEQERKIISDHPAIGTTFLQFNTDPVVLNCVLYHHEKINGKGYPYHRKGGMIPLEARIVAACDVFDALISDRPYQKAMSYDETKRIMCDSVMDGSLDAVVVNALLSVYEKEHIIISEPIVVKEEYLIEHDR